MSDSAAAAGAPSGTRVGRRRWLVAFGLLLGVGLGAVSFRIHRAQQRPLPVLSSLPSFALTNERGLPYGSADLSGHPYVANFIYTHCRDACPQLTARMGQLQDQLRGTLPAVRLVTFSVDPARDQPAVLQAYGVAARADPVRWTFLTGPRETVARLLEAGFKVSMVEDDAPVAPGVPEAVLHDDHFVVVDGRGRIRGYFTADADGLEHIRGALRQLEAAPE